MMSARYAPGTVSCLLVVAVLLSVGREASAVPSRENRSLAKCQSTVSRQIDRYARTFQKAIVKCLDAVAKARVLKAEDGAERAVPACIRSLVKIAP